MPLLSTVFLLSGLCLPLLLAMLLQQRRKAALTLARSEARITEQRLQLAHLSRVALLGELSGAMAHEIKQPLAAILLNAEAAEQVIQRDTIDLDSLRGSLHDILGSARHAAGVVEHLRGLLHKDDAGAQWLPMDLNETTRAVLRLARSDLTRRRVKVTLNFDSCLAGVRGDGVQIQQVILNLIVNACEAMMSAPAETRRLTLATRNWPQSREVELTVSDCGVGIAPLQLERIFEPFVTTKPAGLGLGLSICRSIVEAHGGRISAEPLAAGAAFHLLLPMRT